MTWPRALAAAAIVLSCTLGAAPRAFGQAAQPIGTRVERPPQGSWRRGVLPLPAAAVITVGALVVVAAGALLILRARRRRR